jgi:hypothetical protein
LLDVVIRFICNIPPQMSHNCDFYPHIQLPIATTHSCAEKTMLVNAPGYLHQCAPHTEQPTDMWRSARKPKPPAKFLVKHFG